MNGTLIKSAKNFTFPLKIWRVHQQSMLYFVWQNLFCFVYGNTWKIPDPWNNPKYVSQSTLQKVSKKLMQKKILCKKFRALRVLKPLECSISGTCLLVEVTHETYCLEVRIREVSSLKPHPSKQCLVLNVQYSVISVQCSVVSVQCSVFSDFFKK